MLQHQRTRRDEAGDLCVAEITQQAEDILRSGKADMVALARAFILDPRWPWRAAAALGGKIAGHPQYYRSMPATFPKIFGDAVTNQR